LPTEAEIRGDQPQRGLENNPGKDGQLFSKKHPYFPKNCRECGFNKRKGVVNFLGDFFNNEGVRCGDCEFVPIPSTQVDELRAKLRDYNNDWERTYISSNSNGFVVTQKDRIEEGARSNNERQKFKKELRMCRVLADNGHAVEFLKEGNRPIGETYDIKLDGVKADLKCVTGGAGNIVKYAKKALRGQGGEVVIFELPSHNKVYYDAITEARRKCNGRILFYFSDEKVLKEAKKSGQ
jgi:hypothetical protein